MTGETLGRRIPQSGPPQDRVLEFGFSLLTVVTPEAVQGLRESVGTLPCMSPEQMSGSREVGPDVFSLGIVLYKMLTGGRPFHGDSSSALMSSILSETPPPPSSVRRGISKQFDAILARCLEKDARLMRVLCHPERSDLGERVARQTGWLGSGVTQLSARVTRRPTRPDSSLRSE